MKKQFVILLKVAFDGFVLPATLTLRGCMGVIKKSGGVLSHASDYLLAGHFPHSPLDIFVFSVRLVGAGFSTVTSVILAI